VFTIEFEFDHVKVVSMDETGEHDDLHLYITDDGTVFLAQTELDADTDDDEDIICVKYQQLLDILASLHQAEGTYQNRKRSMN
jgi:hypothetical protein